MAVLRTVVSRVVRVREVVWITALAVMGRDPFTSVILFNVVGHIVEADSLEIVVVMDPDDVTLLCGVFHAGGAVMVTDFSESVETDVSIDYSA